MQNVEQGLREPMIFTTKRAPLKPPVTGVRRRETVTLDVIEKIQWVYPTEYSSGYGMFTSIERTAPQPAIPEGMSLPEYARTIPQEFVGIQKVYQLQGTAKIDGREIPVGSERFAKGVMYIDAIEHPLEVAASIPKIPKDLVEDFGLLGANRIARTRAGTWEPLYEGDSVILTNQPSTPQ